MAATCEAVTAPNSLWNFCPSSAAAYLFTVLFGLTMLAHLSQAIYYRKGYCWVITMGTLWQTLTYIFRILSIQNPAALSDYAAWFVLILVAPLWTNAFVYMVMGRMVWNFTSTARVFGVSAWRFGLYFVILDIIAFIVQIYGASTAAASNSANNSSVDVVLRGLHIYMGGLGIQQLFVLTFFAFAIRFHYTILREGLLDALIRKRALTLLYTLYVCLTLITVRIIFRLIEYSHGLKSTVPNHEAFQYCLDSLPMLLAFVLLNIVHPGRIMKGKEADLPSRKERKERKTKGPVHEMSQGYHIEV